MTSRSRLQASFLRYQLESNGKDFCEWYIETQVESAEEPEQERSPSIHWTLLGLVTFLACRESYLVDSYWRIRRSVRSSVQSGAAKKFNARSIRAPPSMALRYPIEESTAPYPILAGTPMKLPQLFIVSVIGGIASFSLTQMLANRMPSSFIADTADSLGMLYGTLIFGTGLFAILAALTKDLWHSPDTQIFKTRWIVFLPALVGLVGVLHGYLSMAPYYSALPSDIAVPHNTIWATVTVGALFTIVATAIVFAGRRPDKTRSHACG
ncbi:hypothetical protein RBSH_01567 [Rhodopirellula baltica SH28]|uniref:Uncharacterized protein n=2 Tax=Rhodopirellula baltica TaxID=265606 RepID=K5DJS3_RHOBT|nr:hypothetical protein RBSH_01567 [Rhodopirellula baltica SH28]